MIGLYLPLISTVDRIISQQIREVIHRNQIIDGEDLQFRLLQSDLEGRPADPTHPIDGYPSHDSPPE